MNTPYIEGRRSKMERYITRYDYSTNKGEESLIKENTLEEVIEEAKKGSFREDCVVYVAQLIVKVEAEQKPIDATVEFVTDTKLIAGDVQDGA
jgi:hypothetical protein